MREIKFRAWFKISKEMIHSDFVADKRQFQLVSFYHGCSVYPDESEFEFMQYTGLKDKNNKEIYEGDIVIDINDPEKKVVVKFEDGAFYPFWDIEIIIDNRQRYENGREVSSYYFEDLEDVKIVGNIYENPDLIK